MQVEVIIKITGRDGETAEELLGRAAGVLKNQPSILVGDATQSPSAKKAEKVEKAQDEEPKGKRGRPAGSGKKVKDEEPELEDLEISDEEEEESDEDAAEEEDEEPKKPSKTQTKAKGGSDKGSKITIEGDIIPAFKKLTSEHGTKAGAEILSQFNVTSVRDLEEGDLKDVLDALASYRPAKKKK